MRLATGGSESIVSPAGLTWLPYMHPGQTHMHGIIAPRAGKTLCREGVARDARRVVDRLPHSFDVAADESQWLLTLLSAEDLRYIFEGTHNDEPSSR